MEGRRGRRMKEERDKHGVGGRKERRKWGMGVGEERVEGKGDSYKE